MSYIEQSLAAGERVRARAHVHWVVVLAGLPVFLAGLGVSAFVLAESQIFMLHEINETSLFMTFFALGLLMLGLVGMIGGLVYKLTTEIAVTDKKVVFKTGYLSHRTQEQRLNKVESIRVDQGLFGRIFGFGTVYVHGTGSSSTPFHGIADALDFRREVQAAIEAVEGGKDAA